MVVAGHADDAVDRDIIGPNIPEEYRALLDRHGIKYNERYLSD